MEEVQYLEQLFNPPLISLYGYLRSCNHQLLDTSGVPVIDN